MRFRQGFLVTALLMVSGVATSSAQTMFGQPPPGAAPTPPPTAVAAGPDLMPAYASLRAVGLMTDTGQALLWDDAKNEYALLRVGEERGGWRLVAVEKNQAVIVQGAGVREELKLAAAPTEIATAAPGKGKKARTATFVVEPDAPTPSLPTPAEAAAPPPGQRVQSLDSGGFYAAVQGTLPAPEPKLETRNVKRAEFDREIGNFDKLLDQVTVSPAVGGGVVLARMKSAFLTKLGLKEGDVVRTVAGEQVSTVEQAARVYAQLRAAQSFVIVLDRAGARVVIKCDLG